MLLPAASSHTPASSGLAGWFDTLGPSITDAIGKFSTAGATRIIAQPGTTVTTRDAQGNATTIQRTGPYNPAPSLGIGVGAPSAGGDDNSLLLIGGVVLLIVFLVNRK